MHQRLLLLVLSANAAAWTPSSLAADDPKPTDRSVFVATNGNDSWSGKLAQPNAAGTDGPFATIQRALKETRTALGDHTEKSIFLSDGTYFLNTPLVLTAADKGLTLASVPGQRGTLSGGRLLKDWKEIRIGTNTVFTTRIPEELRGKWNFHTLWVNGKPAVRARHPNKGYFAVESLLDKSKDWTDGHSRIRFKEGDLKSWPTITNGEVVVMTRWVESRLPITAIDESERVARFTKRSVFELAPGDLYYVEGVREVLDNPGEWYLDPHEGSMLYYARTGESAGNLQAIAPLLAQVMRVEGSAEQPVKNLRLDGLTFSHTEWYFPDG